MTENGTTQLTHDAVSRETALRQSSSRYEAAPSAFRRAVDAGSATTTAELDAPQIVATGTEDVDEQFHYVYVASAPSGSEEPDLVDRFRSVGLAVVGFGAGLVLVIRGQTMRLRRQ